MARDEFIDNLRVASRLLAPQKVGNGSGTSNDVNQISILQSCDLWLTPKSVQGFNSADFRNWPKEDQDVLEKEVAAFVAEAKRISPNKPATRAQSKPARKHLETVIKVVRGRLLQEWLDAQQRMMAEATTAAKAKGWHVDKDEKQILESLLGAYKAPRLRIRTQDNEFVLDPIARFGSGRQGVVDLVVMPTYETAYLITFKNGTWQIVSREGTFNRRPFSQATLINTLSKLPHP